MGRLATRVVVLVADLVLWVVAEVTALEMRSRTAVDPLRPLCVTCHCSDCWVPCCLDSGSGRIFSKSENLKPGSAASAADRSFGTFDAAKAKVGLAAAEKVDATAAVAACR